MFEGLVDAGSYDEAETLAAELIPRLRQAEDVYLLVFARGAETRLLTRRGKEIDASAVEDWLSRAIRIAPADSLPQLVASGAAARLMLGDVAGALTLLSELEARARAREMPNYPENVPDLVRTALAAGDVHLASRLADGMDPSQPLWEPARLTAGGLLAEARGEQTAAVEMLAAAAPLWERLDRPWDTAQARLGQGRCLIALDRPIEAKNALQQAWEIFAALEAQHALAETDELLHQVRALS